MNALPRQTCRPTAPRRGFTLVEILVVIVIIGILLAIAVPAITVAINRGKTVAMKLEVNSLEDAVKNYEQKYGDYPPDFSSWPVIERHYRKIFPRIGGGELNRLRILLDVNTGNDLDTTFPAAGSWPAHNSNAMDRGEVLAWCLGGYSDSPIAPFTGPGGPLEEVDVATTTSVVFQINSDRPNKLFDFDEGRLDWTAVNASSALSATNRRLSADGDVFASYSAKGNAPFVYFDSRTYTSVVNLPDFNNDTMEPDFNGYGSGAFGLVRPYYSENAVPNNTGADYASLGAALGGWQFMNPDTFQIIAPGLDERFGSTAVYEFDSSVDPEEPVYFQFKTGAAIAPSTQVDTPGQLVITGTRGYQERTAVFNAAENFQLDNITNFSQGALVDEYEP